MNPDVLKQNNSGVPAIEPGRRFFRFDWLFNDAVRSKKRSKLIEVFLRLELPGRSARRTTDKILREQR
jgi:hypothetical protein